MVLVFDRSCLQANQSELISRKGKNYLIEVLNQKFIVLIIIIDARSILLFLIIQHGAAHVYPKMAAFPVTHPLRTEASDVKVKRCSLSTVIVF